MRQVQRVAEIKNSKGKWVQTTSDPVTDKTLVYEYLAKDLIAKKLHKCTYIKSIKDRCNYDGTRDIVVTYDNNVRATYTIKM